MTHIPLFSFPRPFLDNDSGFLTALAGDLYVDSNTGKPIPTQDIPKDAGLYVMDRSGGTSKPGSNEILKVEIPSDCMAIQMGECTQIITGGNVIATPHCVRGSTLKTNEHVSRCSLACFIDTPPQFELKVANGLSRDDIIKQQKQQNNASGERIPSLESRWLYNGMTFGDFLQRTFQMYYNWNNDSSETNDTSNGTNDTKE